MKREDIEKAAADYEDSLLYSSMSEQYNVQKAFKKGADWRINSAWHNASEKPKVRPTLVEYAHIDGSYGYLVVQDATSFGNAIRHWAYIEDLLPNMGD